MGFAAVVLLLGVRDVVGWLFRWRRGGGGSVEGVTVVWSGYSLIKHTFRYLIGTPDNNYIFFFDFLKFCIFVFAFRNFVIFF